MAQQTPPDHWRLPTIDATDVHLQFRHNLQVLRMQFQKAMLDANECMLASEWKMASEKLLNVVDIMLQEKALVSQEMSRVYKEFKTLEQEAERRKSQRSQEDKKG